MASQATFVFNQALWIGGSPCSGKSSIASILAARYNLILVHTDDYLTPHMEQADAVLQPVMHRLSGLSWNRLFMAPVDQQVDDEFKFYREEFPLLLWDMGQLADGRPFLVEGAALLPELLDQHGVKPPKMIYVIPTREFQLQHYAKREFINAILSQCDQPDVAFNQWMERDARFGDRIEAEALALGMPVIRVDERQTLAETAARVEASICR